MKIQFNTDNAAFEEYGMEYQLECIFETLSSSLVSYIFF